jgi:DNA-binding response OmpR family regulator
MRKRILLVDDERELVQAMASNLRKAGYTVFTARKGQAGIDRAQRLLPDLIILDLLLPDIDGFSVCETLRRLPETTTIPVLMMTGMPGEFPRYAGFEAGAVDFIRKPFQWNDFLERTRAALDHAPGTPKAPSVTLMPDKGKESGNRTQL